MGQLRWGTQTMPVFSKNTCSKCGKPGIFDRRESTYTGEWSLRGVCVACRDKQRRRRRRGRLKSERKHDRIAMRRLRLTDYYLRNPHLIQGSKAGARHDLLKYLYRRMQINRSSK